MGKGHGLVRIASLSGYHKVADRVGLDSGPLLKAAGLTPALMSDPEQFVPAEPIVELLEKSALQSGCPTFGLQMARERSISDLGAASVLVVLQPNLEAMLQTICRYRNSILPIIVINVERHDDIAVIGADLALVSKASSRQANDLLLGCLFKFIRAILGQSWQPECTHFTYPEPAPPDRPVYQAVFGPHLQFNDHFNGLTVTLADLYRPREDADPGLAQHAIALARQVFDPEEPTFVQRVQQAVVFQLGSSRATVGNTAEVLGLHPRTLQRRLEDEHVTFRELVHQTRTQLAARFLLNRNLSITEVGEALGYSSTGAFSRWYRHEFGFSPTQGRAQLAEA